MGDWEQGDTAEGAGDDAFVSASDWESGNKGSSDGDNSLSYAAGWGTMVNSGGDDGVTCDAMLTGWGAAEDSLSGGSDSKICDTGEVAGNKLFVRAVVCESCTSVEGAGDSCSLGSSSSSGIKGCDENWAAGKSGCGGVNRDSGNKGDDDGMLSRRDDGVNDGVLVGKNGPNFRIDSSTMSTR